MTRAGRGREEPSHGSSPVVVPGSNSAPCRPQMTLGLGLEIMTAAPTGTTKALALEAAAATRKIRTRRPRPWIISPQMRSGRVPVHISFAPKACQVSTQSDCLREHVQLQVICYVIITFPHPETDGITEHLRSKTPGPGAYSPGDGLDATKPRAPAFSLLARGNVKQDADSTPAPNEYDATQYRARNVRGAKLKFRHAHSNIDPGPSPLDYQDPLARRPSSVGKTFGGAVTCSIGKQHAHTLASACEAYCLLLRSHCIQWAGLRHA